MIKLIIFDFDGTLVDSKEVSVMLYNQLAQKYNARKIETIETLMRLPLLERFKALKIPIYKIPLLVSDLTRLYRDSMINIPMFTGMRELLIDLHRRGYQLAIVSSNSESNIREYLLQNQLDVIETIINSTNIMGKDKVIKKLLTTHQLNPHEVIYVGDEMRDIKACKKIGIKIICVDWGYELSEMFKVNPPDYIVGSANEILSILS